MYYAQLEPWGFDVDDARGASLATVIAAAAGAKDVDPKDFMLRTHMAGSELDAEDQLKAMFPDDGRTKRGSPFGPSDDGGLKRG